MFVMLDVAIGLAFTYLLLSLVCTAINEWIATFSRIRGHYLVKAIGRMVDPGVESARAAKPILEHPDVQALAPKVDRPPSYIPRGTFVRAAGEAKLPRQRTPEEWGELFDASMDRATGWYKRRIQAITFVVAAALTILSNADTLRIADRLVRSPDLRAQFLAAARQRVAAGEGARVVEANYPDPDDPAPADAPEEESAESSPAPSITQDESELLGGVMGWRAEYPAFNARVARRLEAERDSACGIPGRESRCEAVLARIAGDPRVRVDGARIVPTNAWPGGEFLSPQLMGTITYRFPGWLLTIAAISVGAPFWFDTLKRFVNIRGTGSPPEAREQAEAKRRLEAEAAATQKVKS
jgi:hypothetical protein